MKTTSMEGWHDIVLKGVSGGAKKRFEKMMKANGIFE
jgi:hypothetical protein